MQPEYPDSQNKLLLLGSVIIMNQSETLLLPCMNYSIGKEIIYLIYKKNGNKNFKYTQIK